MKNKKGILIAAIAVMLVVAVSVGVAYAAWDKTTDKTGNLTVTVGKNVNLTVTTTVNANAASKELVPVGAFPQNDSGKQAISVRLGSFKISAIRGDDQTINDTYFSLVYNIAGLTLDGAAVPDNDKANYIIAVYQRTADETPFGDDFYPLGAMNPLPGSDSDKLSPATPDGSNGWTGGSTLSNGKTFDVYVMLAKNASDISAPSDLTSKVIGVQLQVNVVAHRI